MSPDREYLVQPSLRMEELKSDEAQGPRNIHEALWVNEVMLYLSPEDLLETRAVNRTNKIRVKGMSYSNMA